MTARHPSDQPGLHPARAALAAALGTIVRLSAHDIARFAAAAGVSVRALRTARRGQPVAVDAHLGLCAALRLDPATGAPVARPLPCGKVRWDHVRASLLLQRAARAKPQPPKADGWPQAPGSSPGQATRILSLREAAEEIGIGAATLLRAERGEAVSVETFLAITAWLGMPPAHLTDEAPCWRVGAARRTDSRQACPGPDPGAVGSRDRACGAGPLPTSPTRGEGKNTTTVSRVTGGETRVVFLPTADCPRIGSGAGSLPTAAPAPKVPA